MKSKLLICSLLGLFLHVAFSFTPDKVPKTKCTTSIEKIVLTADGIAVANYEYFAPVATGDLYFPAAEKKLNSEKHFVPVAEIDERLCIPWDHGLYVDVALPLYKSPHVDDSYVWKFSMQHNC